MIKYHPLEEARDAYLEDLDLKRKSVKDYELLINRYIDYLKRYNIKYAKRSDVIKYRDSMRDEGLKATTIQKQMVVIKSLYRWLRRHNYINKSYYHESYIEDISEGIKGAKVEKSYRKEALSIDQARHLIETSKAYTKTIYGLRNYCMLLLMLTTGLRTIEVARAKRSDLGKIQKQDVLYVQGKGKDGADQFVKLSKPVRDAIKEYLFLRNDKNKFLFISHHNDHDDKALSTDGIRSALKELLKRANLASPKITVHSLRHTCATLSLQTGSTLEQTQQLLRHANIETTLIYAHHLNRINDDTVLKITSELFQRNEED